MKIVKIVMKGTAVYVTAGAFLGALAIIGKRHISDNPEEYPDDVNYVCKMSDAEIVSKCITKWPLVFIAYYHKIKTTK